MIELVFSQLQSFVNNNINNVNNNDDLIKYITQSTQSVTKQQYEKYYNHVVGYYAKCSDPNYDLV